MVRRKASRGNTSMVRVIFSMLVYARVIISALGSAMRGVPPGEPFYCHTQASIPSVALTESFVMDRFEEGDSVESRMSKGGEDLFWKLGAHQRNENVPPASSNRIRNFNNKGAAQMKRQVPSAQPWRRAWPKRRS